MVIFFGILSIYRMTKWTSPLESSHEIKSPRRISLNSETVEFSRISRRRASSGSRKRDFEKNPKKCQIFKECPFNIDEIETETK